MSVKALRDYQRRATLFALKQKAAYLAIDMGLGKTLISLTYIANVLAREKGVKAFLVVGPLRTIHSTWPDEIQKWRPELSYTILHGPNKAKRLKEKVDVYIINYEGLSWLYKELFRRTTNGDKVPFSGLIIDEGSMVKSRNTVRFKILKVLAKRTMWKLILSGTPAPNSLMDLWSQYFLLDGGERLYPAITKYRSEYFNAIQMGPRVSWEVREDAKKVIYSKIESITYYLDKKDHLSLPEKIENVIKVKFTPALQRDYKAFEKDFFVCLSDEKSVEAFNAMSLSMKLRQFVQGAVYDTDDVDLLAKDRRVLPVHDLKLKVLESLMAEANGQGILCAIQFVFEIEIIRKKFPDVKVIASGTTAKNAARYIEEWNRGEIPLLVCHPASLAHGVNLQHGSHIVLWYGLPWSLEHYLQLNDRLHRSGQEHSVVIHHIVAEGTVDEKIMKALQLKLKGQKELLAYLKEHQND